MKNAGRIPGSLRRLLARLLPEEGRDDVLEAMEAVHARLRKEKGRSAADVWVTFQTLKTVPAFLKTQWCWNVNMFSNSARIVWRGMEKQKFFSILNIAGLAAGLACCLLIFLWVRDERGFDRFHRNADKLYLVRCWLPSGAERTPTSRTPPALGPALRAEYPEVVEQARAFNMSIEFLLQIGEAKFKHKVLFADPSIFKMFSFPLFRGGGEETLSSPDAAVVSRDFAARRFGNEDPVGKTIRLDGRFDLRIAGVMKDIPPQSSIRFEVWLPLELMTRLIAPDYLSNWGNMAFLTYVRLGEGVSPAAFSRKISRRIAQAVPDMEIEPFVYPFQDVYLKVQGHEKAVGAFSLIAGLILLMACVNFANLATARAERRAREIGVRKSAGAGRRQLVAQFLGESGLWAFISLVAAVGICALLLPAVRSLSGKTLSLDALLAGNAWPAVAALTISTGFLAGVYPGLLLSSLPAVHTIKGKTGSSDRGGGLRRIMVAVQSGFSILLLVCSVVVSGQIRFMKTQNPGLAKDHLVSIPIQGGLKENAAAMKIELLKNPRIRSVSLTTDTPSYVGSLVTSCRWEGMTLSPDPEATLFGVDADFLQTFGVELGQGRFFSPGAPVRTPDIVINAKLAGLMGGASMVGKRISFVDRDFIVAGVVKDFHFRPLDQELGPLIIFRDDRIMGYRHMFMKIDPADVPGTLAAVAALQKKFNPDFPFEYSFLNEEFDRMYKNDEKTASIVRAFAAVAGLISLLGLFGLSAFMAERRMREIGIRKVLGASKAGIARLLYGGLLPWVLLANLLAWPAGYYIMSRWLRNFAYHSSLNVRPFLLSAGVAALITILASSVQTLKATRRNPSQVLRMD